MSLLKKLALLVAALTLGLSAAHAKKPEGTPEAEPSPFASNAQGERILSFVSDVTVATDASLRVVETIRVNAEGRNILHGIYRDFPTRYERDGRTIRVGFDVQGVQLDGQPVRYRRESISNGVRVRIGDADTNVSEGEHSYVITYTTTRQIGFFPAFDELYWNVTGTDWMFPIDMAEARIHLPQPATFGQRSFYTGAQGSEATDARVVSERPGEIVFRTTRPLGPHEGLTIAVAWPKGVIPPPPPPSAFSQWMAEHGGLATAILGLLLMAGFYFYAWKRAGRGPIPGTVVPLFQPPEGMSAPAVRYVRRMGFDNRVFASAIVESGVKGKIRLTEHQEGLIFKSNKTTVEKTADGGDMDPPLRNMLSSLFQSGDSVEMDKANYRVFQAAKGSLEGGLAEAYKGRYFLTNKGWAWAGFLLMFAVMALVAAILFMADSYAEPGSAGVAFLALGLLLVALGVSPRGAHAGASGWIAIAVAVVAGIAGLFFLFGSLAVADGPWQVLPILSPLLALPLVVSAFWWMAAPTREGRAVMDRIAGFQRYLSVTEENRLEVLHPPEKTPELFERFLPYAIALGVENRWAERFADVLARAAQTPGQNQGMAWYVGSQNAWTNPGRFASTVGAALATSVASAATAPGSSSGSGGGGFSGGGGGGGGGGGW
ncbi:MAG TPA: DUF2207 domain-containing protein [Allosphingosinicella sp.]|jgi:hypothetical protein